MKNIITISTDASTNIDKINLIADIIRDWVVPLLKYHYKVIKTVIEEDVFVRTYIELDDKYTDTEFVNTVNYCDQLTQDILYYHDIDCSVATYTTSLK